MAFIREDQMIIGIPKEVKTDEYRVAIVPAGVEALKARGHKVLIEKNAGIGSGIQDSDFVRAGARIVKTAKELFSKSEMIIKVKEPQKSEFRLLRKGQIIFTYFHFAASKSLTLAMMKSNTVCIAYETIHTDDGQRPLLTPMSEVAGRMAIQEGAKFLEKPMSGRGILLAGVPGVAPANVVIVGGGIVGTNAAKIAAGLGANVSLLDIDLNRLRYLDDIMPPNVTTLMSDSYTIREKVKEADLLVGAVLIEGAKAPVLVPKAMLKTMKPGAVIVDVAVDQGGCIETTRPTTHSNPIYIIDHVVHYCVANMPGAVGRTSTYALTNATLPYAAKIADLGWQRATTLHKDIGRGLNIRFGEITNQAVADAFCLPYVNI